MDDTTTTKYCPSSKEKRGNRHEQKADYLSPNATVSHKGSQIRVEVVERATKLLANLTLGAGKGSHK